VPELLDTSASQHLSQAVAACRKPSMGPVRAGCLRIVRLLDAGVSFGPTVAGRVVPGRYK
jgi:hypothetical protein